MVIKPNVGGSGWTWFDSDSLADLAAATKDGGVDLGLDQVGLVQEFIPAQGGHITRVEGLGGKFLYAIKSLFDRLVFDLARPTCTRPRRAWLSMYALVPWRRRKRALKVEGYHPPADVIADIERTFLASTASTSAGIEYVIDVRDGQL